MFWQKLKTAAESALARIQAGFILAWFEETASGVTLNYRKADGTTGTIAGGGSGGGAEGVPGTTVADAVEDPVTGVVTVAVRPVSITAAGVAFAGPEQTLICAWPAPEEEEEEVES